jgi:hypothetical protein
MQVSSHAAAAGLSRHAGAAHSDIAGIRQDPTDHVGQAYTWNPMR